ncbi:MAG: glycosyltransferase family 61 protein [Chlamydiales bacterium]|nr:glycosyltransferase family 61 protein [Chlamydiales bacterium]
MSFNQGFVTLPELRQLDSYQRIYPEEKTTTPSFPWYENDKKQDVTIQEAFVVTLRDGVVCNKEDSQAVATASGKLVTDLSHSWKIPVEQHPILQQREFPTLQYVDEKVAILHTTGAHYNYYHWMIDLLPRIDLIRKSGLQPVKYYLRAPIFPYQKETLQKLGIQEKDCLYVEDYPFLKAKELIGPSLAAPPFKVPIPHWATQFLRSSFLPNEILQPTERIYISRKQASSRRVVNEEELLPFLERNNFKVVVLENLTVAQQAHLFASARTIIAVHGAALTNLVFSAKGTQVIELFHPKFILHCYHWLSYQRELPYVTQMTEPVGEEKDFDMRVDPNKLKELINNLQ